MALYHAERLANVHPDLVRLMIDAGKGGIELVIIQGARSVADEEAAMASGHSALKDPMNSKHVIDPVKRPLALAVDAAPYPTNWQDIPAFEALGSNLKALADTIGVAIKWGGDWTSLKDYDHFELAETTDG